MMKRETKFNRIAQRELLIPQYTVQLQDQVEFCRYGTMKCELVRGRSVVWVKESNLREYLIDLENLDKTQIYTETQGLLWTSVI